MKRRLAMVAVVLASTVLAGEWFARWGLGLGDPPLSISHPQIEYLFKPNQEVYRFGNRVKINAYGMRSADFSPQKAEDEYRVLVFGDSVLNGGALSDQHTLATELLRHKLLEMYSEVTVGNVSAGSWGPGNWLGYAQTYGFFDADVVLLLISSHDEKDNPSFASLNPQTHPQRRPASALWEGVTRYLPRYMPSLALDFEGRGSNVDIDMHAQDSADPSRAAQQGLSDLRDFLIEAQQATQQVVVIQFLERSELQNQPKEGHSRIEQTVQEMGIALTSSETLFRAAIGAGVQPYRDNIHINDDGQAVLADVLWSAITEHAH